MLPETICSNFLTSILSKRHHESCWCMLSFQYYSRALISNLLHALVSYDKRKKTFGISSIFNESQSDWLMDSWGENQWTCKLNGINLSTKSKPSLGVFCLFLVISGRQVSCKHQDDKNLNSYKSQFGFYERPSFFCLSHADFTLEILSNKIEELVFIQTEVFLQQKLLSLWVLIQTEPASI